MLSVWLALGIVNRVNVSRCRSDYVRMIWCLFIAFRLKIFTCPRRPWPGLAVSSPASSGSIPCTPGPLLFP